MNKRYRFLELELTDAELTAFALAFANFDQILTKDMKGWRASDKVRPHYIEHLANTRTALRSLEKKLKRTKATRTE